MCSIRCGCFPFVGLDQYSPARKLISKVMTVASGIWINRPLAPFLSINFADCMVHANLFTFLALWLYVCAWRSALRAFLAYVVALSFWLGQRSFYWHKVCFLKFLGFDDLVGVIDRMTGSPGQFGLDRSVQSSASTGWAWNSARTTSGAACSASLQTYAGLGGGIRPADPAGRRSSSGCLRASGPYFPGAASRGCRESAGKYRARLCA